MKLQTLAVLSCLALTSASNGALIITAVYDGPLSGGTPKGIELYATTAIADLSIYGVGAANNGGGSDGQEFTFPAVTVGAGEFLYVASESAGFTNFFGFAPDYTTISMGINGDDAIELFQGGLVIDTFGDINTDGSGEAWDYLDGWAYRVSDSTVGAFDLGEWTFSGINALDGETANDGATNPVPIGTFTAVPEPSSVILGGVGLLALLRRRR
jgi:hypothetical protein